MTDPTRVSPDEARQLMQSKSALLVCAYEDERKCRRNRLDGALTLQELQARGDELPGDVPLVFYCG